MVEIEKRFVRKKPNTSVAITEEGRERTARHWQHLEALRDQALSASQASHSARRSASRSRVRPA